MDNSINDSLNSRNVKTGQKIRTRPRNTIEATDAWEVIKYCFSVTMLKELFKKFGYFIHDHVAPIHQMNKKRNPRIHPSASLRYGYNIYLGNNSHINQYCCIWASENAKIILGDNLLMGPGVKMFSSNHSTNEISVPMNIQPLIEKDIEIGHDVWIGSNSVILAGAKIGDGSVIAAGSVVNKEIPSYVIAAGVPAKAIKERK
jgi:acetyltransferase-like isoleucine patch superfamily enzyme